MQNKAIQRNVIASFAALASNTYSSAIHTNTWGKGIRLYVNVAAGANTGGVESILLATQPPAGGALIPLAGFSAAGLLTTNGVAAFAFHPGAWIPAAGMATAVFQLGAAGIYLPLLWAVQLVLPGGSHSTISVDAEILP